MKRMLRTSIPKVLERDADGSRVGVTGTITAVAKARQTEDARSAGRAHFQAVVDAAANAIIVAYPDGSILSANPATIWMFGYDRIEELIGRNLTVLTPAKEATRLGGYIADRRAGMLPVVIGVSGDELFGIHRDGSAFPIEISVTFFAADGESYLTGIIRDVSDRVRADIAIRDSEARLRLVQYVGGVGYTDQTLPEPIVLVSLEFNRIYGLPLEQTRIPHADIVARIHPDDRDRIGALTPATLEHDGKLAVEFRICRPDGEVRFISMQTEAFLGRTGSVERIVSAQQDITDVVATREALTARSGELERSNANLEEFAYAVSHDLRAPLRAIDHLVQWINDDIKEIATPETIENLNLLQGRIVRMQALIAGLLEYSRVGSIDEITEDVEVGEVVSDIVAMQGLPPAFVVSYEGDGLRLRTQRVALQVVLENLISNSVKHHDLTEGRVSITARLVNGIAEIRVSDDGPGIPEQFHQRIFAIFQTLKSKDQLEANGIGLAMVKRKVESHGGRIWVDSAPPVRGTTFVFTWT